MKDAEIQSFFDDRLRRSGSPGATMGIAHDGQMRVFASGVLEPGGVEPVGPDSQFLIGSTTKAFTASLIWQLADAGRLCIDDRVRTHLPDLALGDEDAAATVTIRQLLNHTSGIDNGPYEQHEGRPDPTAEYLAAMRSIPVLHVPGERFGYSNAAYVMAGRIIERVTGETWGRVLESQLLEPAGMDRTDAGGDGITLLPAMAATGATVASTAADLLAFAQLHLDLGEARGGARILSERAAVAMRSQDVRLPVGARIACGWCPGLLVEDWDGHSVYGHTGHNAGAGSYVRFSPEHSLALVVLFTSPGDPELCDELARFVFGEVAGISKPEPWVRCDTQVDVELAPYAGVYERHGLRLTFDVEGDGLMATVEPEALREAIAAGPYRPATETVFASGSGGPHLPTPPAGRVSPELVFDGFDAAGRPNFLYTSVFVMRRVA